MFPFIVVSQATSIQTLFLTEKLWFLGDNVECELETWCGLRCTHLTHIPFISTWLELSFIHREFISIADVKIAATTIRTFVDFRTFSSSHKFSIPNTRVTLYTAGHLHTAVPYCSHSRAPIVHTAVPRENNEHGCVYLRCRAVCKLPGCVEGHPWIWVKNLYCHLLYTPLVRMPWFGASELQRLCCCGEISYTISMRNFSFAAIMAV